MNKLLQLGWVVEVWVGAIDGNLYVTLTDPRSGPDEESRHSLLCSENAEGLLTQDVQQAIETRLKQFYEDNLK
ncbi:MAG: hypothetical protein GY906_04895 [bacterium]|nr:hypothetical protein [bacterium]